MRVNKTVGELSVKVKQLQAKEWSNSPRRVADGRVEYLSNDEQLQILKSMSKGLIRSIEGYSSIISGGVVTAPSPDEDHHQGKERYIQEMQRLRDCCFDEIDQSRVLVIAHGDTVDGAVHAFTNDFCWETNECCWVAFGFDEQRQPTLLDSNLLSTMSRDLL